MTNEKTIELVELNDEAKGEYPQYQIQNTEQRQLVASAPADLFMLAMSKGATLEQIEKVMELQERHEANQAKKAYVAAMAEFKRNAPKIGKDAHVEHSGISYNHATLGNICNIVIPALAEHGISHNWEQDQSSDGMIRVTCTLTHSLGHSQSNSMQAPPDNTGKKNGIQSLSSTVTYLQRYTFLAACGLSTSEIDDDGKGYSDVPEQKEIVKSTLSRGSFAKAELSVRNGEWTKADIEEKYKLTTDQEIALRDAEAEFKKGKK